MSAFTFTAALPHHFFHLHEITPSTREPRVMHLGTNCPTIQTKTHHLCANQIEYHGEAISALILIKKAKGGGKCTNC
jgi:hypothetical protein